MENNNYTISVYLENSPGALQRVTTSFTKRKINIDSLTVSETSESGLSLITIVASVPVRNIETIVKQIERIIEVKKVFASMDQDLLYVEVALIRISLENQQSTNELERIIERHAAKMIYVDDNSAVIEALGTEDQINIIYRLLGAYDVLQFVRTGRIALKKEFKSIYAD